MNIDELRALLEPIEPTPPIVGSFLVSPDVWQKLVEALPTTEMAMIWTVPVHRVNYLPPGTVVPLDTKGRPMPDPKDRPPHATNTTKGEGR